MSAAFPLRRLLFGALTSAGAFTIAIASCTDSYRLPHPGGGSGAGNSTGGGGGTTSLQFQDVANCPVTCSNDLKSVVDCAGRVLATCSVEQGCADGICIDNPCTAAVRSKSSYGCDYWAIKTAQRPQADGACFAAFVANTWGKPVHIQVERDGRAFPVATFAGVPVGQGPSLTYRAYDEVQGLGVGEVAILFLSRKSLGGSAVLDCPIPAIVSDETGVDGTGIGKGFHITTDYPVVAYQMVPYGGSHTYVTSATLLLPTSSWDNNYLVVSAYPSSEPAITGGNPSLDVVASVDNTTVTLLPNVPVGDAGAGQPFSFTLNAGEFMQISQNAELTGSPILATQPVAVFGGSACMEVPVGQQDCDSAQQQIPPIRALGNEYVAVRHRGRHGVDGGVVDEAPPWRIVGAVDGTQLAFEGPSPVQAPTRVGQGQVVEFRATGPFVVKSQDNSHPFYLGGYMTGGQPFGGEGDPDWVNVIPPSQYLNHYILFTDPTYPETNLVIVRTPSKVDGSFADVTLSCAGGVTKVLGPWSTVGAYQYMRVDLSTGNYSSVDGCSNGRQEITSDLPFGVTVWGWGTPATQTGLVSYAYPAGAGFQPINHVTIPPVPR